MPLVIFQKGLFMTKKINILLFSGSVNKDFKVRYSFTFETDGKYNTVFESNKGDLFITPKYSLTLTTGFNKESMFIQSSQYHTFTDLIQKIIDLIKVNFYDLYPNPDGMDFEVNNLLMETYMTEKALSGSGITVYPSSYYDNENLGYPAIQISNSSNDIIKIPLNDALSMNQMFKSLDINTFTLQAFSTLRMLINNK